MLRDYKYLLLVHLRMRFGFAQMRLDLKNGGKPRRKIVGMAALFLYAGVVLMGMYCALLFAMFAGAKLFGLENVIMGTVALLSMAVVLIFGTVSLLGLVMNARDAEIYASMPLRPSAVFAAKFSMVYLTELAFSAALLLPAVIVYAAVCGGDIGLFIRALLLVPLTPIIPLAVSAVIALPLSRFTGLFRRRELFALIGGIFAVLLAVFGQLWLSRTLASSIIDPQQIFSGSGDLMQAATSAFPPAGWLASALLGTGSPWLSGALYVLLSAALLLAAVWLSSKLYERAVLSNIETIKKPARRKGAVRQNSLVKTLMLREWRCIIRSSVYALNSLVGVIMFPLMLFVIPLSSGSADIFSQLLTDFPIADADMMLIIAGIFTFMGFVNPAATTSISREGKAFSILRSMPISMAVQIKARLYVALCIASAGVLLAAVILVYMNLVSPAVIVCSLILSVAANFSTIAVSMIPDIRNPKLNWSTEAEAMKQNFNSLTGMLISIVVMLLLFGITIAVRLLQFNMWVTLALLVAVFAAIGYFSLKLTTEQARKAVANYE